MPDSAIAGASRASADPGSNQLHGAFLRSLRIQLNVLVLLFLTLPVLLYITFSQVDKDRRNLVLNTIRNSGLTISAALRPMLETATPEQFDVVQTTLNEFGAPHRRITLLYRPVAEASQGSFYLVALVPAADPSAGAAERDRLNGLGILNRLAQSCEGDMPLSDRVSLPSAGSELLTSVSPVLTKAGCWAVVLASDEEGEIQLADSRAYWGRPAMEVALGLYAAMALLGLAIFISIRSTLGRLRRTAQDAETGATFAGGVTVPEFMPLAVEFDLMVGRLRRAAATLRQAAEDNAHALKGPLAVITQLVDGLRSEPPDTRALPAKLVPIDAAVRRLDGLVRSAQQLDSATAELLEGERHKLELSALVNGFAEEYQLMLGDRAQCLVVEVHPGIEIVGNEETVEVILENLVENALSFTPPTGIVRVLLTRTDDKATLIVSDDGPGVPPAILPKIFDRYFSSRRTEAPGKDGEGGTHFGIGLWLVRQHVIGLEGTVKASNRAEGGFEVKITLPTAPHRR